MRLPINYKVYKRCYLATTISVFGTLIAACFKVLGILAPLAMIGGLGDLGAGIFGGVILLLLFMGLGFGLQCVTDKLAHFLAIRKLKRLEKNGKL